MCSTELLEKIISEMNQVIPVSLVMIAIGAVCMLFALITFFVTKWDHPIVIIILSSLGFALFVTGLDTFFCAKDILNNINNLPEYSVLKYFAHFD